MSNREEPDLITRLATTDLLMPLGHTFPERPRWKHWVTLTLLWALPYVAIVGVGLWQHIERDAGLVNPLTLLGVAGYTIAVLPKVIELGRRSRAGRS